MTGIPKIQPYAMPTSAQLPANIASWKIDPDRAVLLVHDMQRYFLRPIPSEGLGSVLVKNAASIRRRCQALGIPVAYTAQPGGMTAEERGLLKDFWGSGMQVDPVDRNVVDELSPIEGDWSLTKWRYSAFWKSNLLKRMREAGRDQLIICGVYAHIGVLMTAVEAFSNDIETFVVGDAVADFSLERHLMALEYAARCCAVVVTSEQVAA
ncbi:isochorismatase family protein [Lysobacter antibioticus]|uniref:isochorismatase family protein n=1 Tax=Lysobacter antibioticus TaxID=84531 RepID=UPI0004D00AF0|nr:isochorismatase family protein [Lysobacter antibioticus]